MLYVIAYDIGTTGLKTCLFSIGETIEMIAGTYSDYDLSLPYRLSRLCLQRALDELDQALRHLFVVL